MWQILIVEDEPDSRDLIHSLLSYHGMQTMCVDSGEAALDALQEFTPDMVIVDLALPGIDGWTLVAVLRELPALQDTRFVAVTAYHNPRVAQEVSQAGFHGYIEKPIEATIFYEQIMDVLES